MYLVTIFIKTYYITKNSINRTHSPVVSERRIQQNILYFSVLSFLILASKIPQFFRFISHSTFVIFFSLLNHLHPSPFRARLLYMFRITIPCVYLALYPRTYRSKLLGVILGTNARTYMHVHLCYYLTLYYVIIVIFPFFPTYVFRIFITFQVTYVVYVHVLSSIKPVTRLISLC